MGWIHKSNSGSLILKKRNFYPFVMWDFVERAWEFCNTFNTVYDVFDFFVDGTLWMIRRDRGF